MFASPRRRERLKVRTCMRQDDEVEEEAENVQGNNERNHHAASNKHAPCPLDKGLVLQYLIASRLLVKVCRGSIPGPQDMEEPPPRRHKRLPNMNKANGPHHAQSSVLDATGDRQACRA